MEYAKISMASAIEAVLSTLPLYEKAFETAWQLVSKERGKELRGITPWRRKSGIME
jgi:hypothetical protein